MEQQYRIKNSVVCEGESLRKTAKITGHDFETVKKYSLKENFEFGIKVFEESLKLGAKDFDSIKFTFYRLKNGTLQRYSGSSLHSLRFRLSPCTIYTKKFRRRLSKRVSEMPVNKGIWDAFCHAVLCCGF